MQKHRQKETQTETQTDGRTNGRTDGQVHRLAGRQIERMDRDKYIVIQRQWEMQEEKQREIQAEHERPTGGEADGSGG